MHVMYSHICICAYMYICIYTLLKGSDDESCGNVTEEVCIYICVYIYIYIYIFVYIYIYVLYLRIYICAYMYICICILVKGSDDENCGDVTEEVRIYMYKYM
jgi:hypothetical protein